MQALTACTLVFLIGLASAARTEPFSGQQATLPADLREPVVPDQVHVRANGCTAAPAGRSAAAARGVSSVAVLVQGAGRGSCSPTEFRIHWLGAGTAVPAACGSVQLQNPDGEAVKPRLLILSGCDHDAVIALRPQVGGSTRRSLRDSVYNAQGQYNVVAKPNAGSGTNQTTNNNYNGNKANGACSTNCPTSSTIIILMIVTFGVIFGAIVAASILTKCGPCRFCWWAWRHRHDPPTQRPNRCPCKGDPVKAAQQISAVVAPCSEVQREKAGECPVCLTAEGDWSALPCGHAICNTCLAQLVKAQAMLTRCPLCRDPLLPDAAEHKAADSSTAGSVSNRSSTFSRSSADTAASAEAGVPDGSSGSDGGSTGDGASGGSSAGGNATAAAAPAISVVQLTSIPETTTPAAAAVAAAGDSLCSAEEAAEVDSILQPSSPPHPEPPVDRFAGSPLQRRSQEAGPSSG